MKNRNLEELEQKIAKLQAEIDRLEKENQILEKVSIHDKLTGVLNRRPLEDLLRKQIARFYRHRENFAVLLVDGDNFKQINDTYGHLIGDRYLQILTDIIGKNLRESDWILRYGGEEFIVVLQDTGREEAIILGERITKIVSAYDRFPTDKPEEFRSWTVSVGISLMQDGDSHKSLLERADKALYFSKEGGKNRVSLAMRNLSGHTYCKNVTSDRDIIWN